MNLWDLMRDWAQLLRLQYRPAETYRYGLIVLLALVLAIGVVNAANSLPILGNSVGVFWFAAVVAIARCLLLARIMSSTFHYFGAERMPFLGFTLVTEAMIIPNILLFYFKELSFIFMLWNTWAMYVQAVGFYRLSHLNSLKALILAYLFYLLASMVLVMVMLILFAAANWIDINSIQTAIEAAMSHQP